jgi:hypothetical protein
MSDLANGVATLEGALTTAKTVITGDAATAKATVAKAAAVATATETGVVTTVEADFYQEWRAAETAMHRYGLIAALLAGIGIGWLLAHLGIRFGL